MRKLGYAAVLVLTLAFSLAAYGFGAIELVEGYLRVHRLENCWLKQRMNAGEPPLAAKLKAACERLAAGIVKP